jgi:hypothetical protein
MSESPERLYFELEMIVAGAFVVAIGALHLWRTFRSETRPRKCVFCDDLIPADEYAHHLEICGLKTLSRRGPDRARF